MNALERNRLVSLASHYQSEQLSFLTDICHINTYSHNKTGTDSVAELVLDELSGMFPVHKVVSQTDVGDHHIFRTRESGPHIYLVGHMDTVFPPDHRFQTCRREGDWLIGPGVADMKGGISVLVFSLKVLQEIGLLQHLNLTVIASSDEELGSRSSRVLFEKERQSAAACLVFECGGRDGSMVVSRNGKAGARFVCRGQDRHVGNGTHEKTSAILELSHKVIALEGLNSVLPGVSCNVGHVHGGLGPSTVPAEAHILFDIRWHEQAHYESLVERIEEIAGKPYQSGATSEFTILNYRPAMPRTDVTDALFQRMQRTAASLGQTVAVEHRRGTSDANFFGSIGVPTLDGLGPVGEHDHTDRERILISTLVERTALVATFLAEYGTGL